MNASVSMSRTGMIALLALVALLVAAGAATAVEQPTQAAGTAVILAPQLQPISCRCVVGRQTSYEPGDWDYYWSGHHEPDPNLHTWEPWRYCELIQARSVFY